MNKVLLTGRIANDLEIRKTQNNKSYMQFSIAIDKGTKDQNGNRQAEFVDIQCWEQRAEFLNQYAYKGVLIGVIGKIESSVYEKNNVKQKRTYVIAEQVEILNKPQTQQQPQAKTIIERTNNNFGGGYEEIKTDDLPFY